MGNVRGTAARTVRVFVILLVGGVVWAAPPETDPFDFSIPAGDPMAVDYLLSDLHAYAGFASVLLGMATGMATPHTVGTDVHEKLAIASAGMSALTIGLGFAAHSGDLGLRYGGNTGLVHALLGIAGGGMMIAAPFIAPAPLHQAVGEIGALAMGGSVIWSIAY